VMLLETKLLVSLSNYIEIVNHSVAEHVVIV